MKDKIFYLICIIFFITNSFCQNVADDNIKILGLYKTDDDKPNDIVVKKFANEGIVFFKADLDMDLDGCPFAYKPDNKGLCNNGNAKGKNSKSGYSHNIILHNDENPVIQGIDDKAPGYFISLTSLSTDGAKNTSGQYVDALEVPYVVLPSKLGINRGDIVLVYNTKNDKFAFAINADGNDTGIIGEGSAKLIECIGLPLIKVSYYHCNNCMRYNYSKKCRKCKNEGDLFCEKCKLITTNNDGKDFIYIAFPNSGKLIGKNKISQENLKIDTINKLGEIQILTFKDVKTLVDKLRMLCNIFYSKWAKSSFLPIGYANVS